jgi:hypothetical protein
MIFLSGCAKREISQIWLLQAPDERRVFEINLLYTEKTQI